MTNLSHTTQRLVRRFADSVHRVATVESPNNPKNSWDWGTVQSIQTGPPLSLTLQMSGSTSAVNRGVRYVSSYSPSVGDVVFCTWHGKDLVVVGAMAPIGKNTKTIRIGLTYAVQGLITVPSGATAYLPPFFIPVPFGQSTSLVGVVATVRGGTSVTGSFYHGAAGAALPGSTIGGLTGLVISTSLPTSMTAPTHPEVCADCDYLHFVPTAISGTPDGLTCSFFFDVTV